MKIYKQFKELEFKDKSEMLSTWIRTTAIVFGIVFGLLQWTASVNTTNRSILTKTYSELESYEVDIANAYKILTNYYEELYPYKEIKNVVDHNHNIEMKFSKDSLEKHLNIYISETDELIKYANSGILDKEVTYNALQWRLSLLLAHIIDYKEHKEVIDIIPFAQLKLELRFDQVAPWLKRIGYYNSK